MKKSVLFSAVALAVLASACANDDERFFGNGDGKVQLVPEIKSDIKVVSRASANEADLNESLILWVSNAKGPVRKFNGLENVPAEEYLASGHYIAEAWAGDSVSASFSDRWFKGAVEFDVRRDDVATVAIPCKIANVLVEVHYADDIDATLAAYTMTVGHKRGSLEFVGADTRTAYFMMPSTDKNLAWSFEAETTAGDKISRTGVIESAKPATKYILNVSFNPTVSEIGGAYFDLVVDTTERQVYDEFSLELPPVITGSGFNLAEELLAKPGEVGRKSIYVSAACAMTSVEVSLPGLSTLLGITDSEGGSFDDVNLIGSGEFYDHLVTAGLQGIYEYDDEEGVSTLKINFDEQFTNSLPDGIYSFAIKATDVQGRVSDAVFTIHVSNDPLGINDIVPADVWATTALFAATVLRDDYGTPALQYRRQGDSEWINAAHQLKGSLLVASISGLTPATTYEYRATTDAADGFETAVKTFTTESELQLPNSGFEEWNTSKTPYLIYGEGSAMFWDSGNHGSATLNKNITVPDESVKHSGKYSIKMASEKIVVKFAAGNAFVGQYLATEGTDGQLGWGRPFSSRPKTLKGYVKYDPKAITDVNDSSTGKSKGDMDEGIIYIAILDGTTDTANASDKDYVSSDVQKNWPVIIMTKSSKRQVFNPHASNVIAYGEKVFTTATDGDGMVEFEIPLDYLRTDVKAVNIMVTMSASRYGDYFTGGPSTMWVDDLQLVY